jgi:hypothetical protein
MVNVQPSWWKVRVLLSSVVHSFSMSSPYHFSDGVYTVGEAFLSLDPISSRITVGGFGPTVGSSIIRDLKG